uniref:Sulfotransferase domain-containing protein n=1 Tax=Alexandrium andersonii TaxID=327968 RepID=A0A7S2N9E1_9DINO
MPGFAAAAIDKHTEFLFSPPAAMVRWCVVASALLPWGSFALRHVHDDSKPSKEDLDAPIGSSYAVKGHRDLVLMHVPYNFGHTIEKVAMMPKDAPVLRIFEYTMASGGAFHSSKKVSWRHVRKYAKPNAEVWGHFHPDLMETNNQTRCNNYFTPQKYWPEELARTYFGNKTIFGMLRDPAERLVANFRGNAGGYGGGFSSTDHNKCDVNHAVKSALKEHIASGNKFSQECTFVPQAEYFDGPYGITLPVDNRRFPDSMNEVFKAHHYDEMFIEQRDILHVNRCNNVWAADLDAETRALIRQVYARDYELLCKHFGYCDPDENTCIRGVHQMCPSFVMQDQTATGK